MWLPWVNLFAGCYGSPPRSTRQRCVCPCQARSPPYQPSANLSQLVSSWSIMFCDPHGVEYRRDGWRCGNHAIDQTRQAKKPDGAGLEGDGVGDTYCWLQRSADPASSGCMSALNYRASAKRDPISFLASMTARTRPANRNGPSDRAAHVPQQRWRGGHILLVAAISQFCVERLYVSVELPSAAPSGTRSRSWPR